jgi:hypothetical protein
MSGVSCSSCRYFATNGMTGEGVCKRHPPSIVIPVMVKGAPQLQIVQATVHETDWCGDWKPVA